MWVPTQRYSSTEKTSELPLPSTASRTFSTGNTVRFLSWPLTRHRSAVIVCCVSQLPQDLDMLGSVGTRWLQIGSCMQLWCGHLRLVRLRCLHAEPLLVDMGLRCPIRPSSFGIWVWSSCHPWRAIQLPKYHQSVACCTIPLCPGWMIAGALGGHTSPAGLLPTTVDISVKVTELNLYSPEYFYS